MPKMIELTQRQKILTIMCRSAPNDWFFPYDFMDQNMGDLFVGYEASARLSELASSYPEMVESEHAGKYIRRRLRLTELDGWFEVLPKDLRYVFHRAGLTANLKRPQRTFEPDVERRAGIKLMASYKGRTYHKEGYQTGTEYELRISRLKVGKPVRILSPFQRIYPTAEAFGKEWEVKK